MAQILGAVEAARYDARIITGQCEERAQQMSAAARGNSVAMIGLLLLIVSPFQRP